MKKGLNFIEVDAECCRAQKGLHVVELGYDVLDDIHDQWGNTAAIAANPTTFDWEDIIDGLEERQDGRHERFGWGLYVGDKLCAAVAGYVCSPYDGSSITITNIQGSPDASHPLKGRVIAYALDIAETIAQEEGLDRVIVDRAIPETHDIYLDHGYRERIRSGRQIASYFIKDMS